MVMYDQGSVMIGSDDQWSVIGQVHTLVTYDWIRHPSSLKPVRLHLHGRREVAEKYSLYAQQKPHHPITSNSCKLHHSM